MTKRAELVNCIWSGEVAAVRSLIVDRQLLEQIDEVGWTPLFEAVAAEDREVVVALLEAGANTDHRDFAGWRAGDFAVAEQSPIAALLDN